MNKEDGREIENILHDSDSLRQKIEELDKRIATLEKKDDHLALVLFSGDFDKAMAVFIITNGAIAMDMKVTIYATFWGLDILKRSSFTTNGREFLERMMLARRLSSHVICLLVTLCSACHLRQQCISRINSQEIVSNE